MGRKGADVEAKGVVRRVKGKRAERSGSSQGSPRIEKEAEDKPEERRERNGTTLSGVTVDEATDKETTAVEEVRHKKKRRIAKASSTIEAVAEVDVDVDVDSDVGGDVDSTEDASSVRSGKSSIGAPQKVAVDLQREIQAALQNGGEIVAENDDKTFAELFGGNSEGERRSERQPDTLSSRLSPALLEVLNALGYGVPTPVQRYSLPIFLKGTDLLINAGTGTGKTLAYAIPLIQMVLESQQLADTNHKEEVSSLSLARFRSQLKSLVLVPSRELCLQVSQVITSIAQPLGVRSASIVDRKTELSSLTTLLASRPQILTLQPSSLLHLVKALFNRWRKENLTSEPSGDALVFFPELLSVVFDEADLILRTFGFKDETSLIFAPPRSMFDGRPTVIIPTSTFGHQRKAQLVFASATLNHEVDDLKKICLSAPHLLTLIAEGAETFEPERETERDTEGALTSSTLTGSLPVAPLPPAPTTRVIVPLSHSQSRHCALTEKFVPVPKNSHTDFLALFCILKTQPAWLTGHGLRRPRIIIFCNTDHSAYRVALFLQIAFGAHPGKARPNAQRAKAKGRSRKRNGPATASAALSSVVVTPTQTLGLRLQRIADFGRGLHDVLVACDSDFLITHDEHNIPGEAEGDVGRGLVKTENENGNENGHVGSGRGENEGRGKKMSRKERQKLAAKNADKTASSSRGIDFKKIDLIINFEVPPTVEEYVHRIGRAARVPGANATALTFLPEGEEGLEGAEAATLVDERGLTLLDFEGDPKTFSYRVDDFLTKVSPAQIQKLQVADLSAQIDRSALTAADQALLRLARHFN